MRRLLVLLALLAFMVTLVGFGQGGAEHEAAGEAAHTSVYGFLFEVVIILLAA